MNIRQVKIVGLIVIIGLIGIFTFTQLIEIEYRYQGSLIDPPLKAQDFSLIEADGTVFKLSDHEGEVVLMFFGYTNCPDVCPTTMSDFKNIINNLGDQEKDVSVVFITVDPERDTPEVMSEYVAAFHPDFIGLSGSMEELHPIWDSFYVFQQKMDSDSHSDYLVDHSSRAIAVDKYGNFRLTFPFGMSWEGIKEDISHLITE